MHPGEPRHWVSSHLNRMENRKLNTLCSEMIQDRWGNLASETIQNHLDSDAPPPSRTHLGEEGPSAPIVPENVSAQADLRSRISDHIDPHANGIFRAPQNRDLVALAAIK